MLKFLKNLVFVTLPTLLVLILLVELVFRFILPAAEEPQGFFDEAVPVYRFDTSAVRTGQNTIGKFAQIKTQWRINNYGWISAIDYATTQELPLIAVFGDSYIQAMTVDTDQAYPALLRSQLKEEYEVYSFGVSGSPLSEYLTYMRYANERFEPDILLFNIIPNDFAPSLYSINPDVIHYRRFEIASETDSISEIPPQKDLSFIQYNTTKRWLVKSAFVRYLYRNLRIKEVLLSMRAQQQKNNINANTQVSLIRDNFDAIVLGVRYFMDRIKKENPGKRIILVMDAPRQLIYEGTLEQSTLTFLYDKMAELCDEFSLEFIDLTKTMAEDFDLHGKRFNSELDGHWNAYGHAIVAREIEQAIRRNDPPAPSKDVVEEVPTKESTSLK